MKGRHRDPGRTYSDEDKIERKQRLLLRLKELIEVGLEAESEYVNAVKAIEPDVTPEKLKELIMQFRDAVYEKQQRDSRRR